MDSASKRLVLKRADDRVSVRVPSELAAEAKRLAEADDRSVSYIMRQALAEYVVRRRSKVA